jgi:Ni,Fe-hydrogenase III large subunit
MDNRLSTDARLCDAIAAGRLARSHRPWPRAEVGEDLWRQAIVMLSDGRLTLLGLWAEATHVHMAVMEEAPGDFGVLSLACRHARFPSVGQMHPPAIRLERAIHDLWRLIPNGLADLRPWLDHGKRRGGDADPDSPPYAFLPAEGESLHQIPVGPVHAGIIEPGHFRFTANGEAIVRLEERLGYVHKGIERLMAGSTVMRATVLAGRVSGDSTVAYSLAFARAVEAAHALAVPERAVWLRALMAELERLANHFGDIGAICNDAAFAMMHAHCGYLREQVLRVAEQCFGHRLMMDRVVPGGVTQDLAVEAEKAIRSLLSDIRRRFPELVELYDNTASLQDRTVGTGVLSAALARQFGCGGYVGRASGRRFDARRMPGYPPYDQLTFDVPVLDEGDVNARVWIRVREIEQSLSLIDQLLEGLPAGPIGNSPMPLSQDQPSEGIALVEGFRGDILVWVRTEDNGTVARCHLRDPSWFQWPVLEAAVEGNIVADFPLCNKSFNCSYSGHDL